MNKSLLSRNSDNWRTPSDLYYFFVNKYKFLDLFPFESKEDQYQKMYVKQKLFINPPYSHLRTSNFRNYIKKLIELENDIFLLIPSRTDTLLFDFLVNSYWCYDIFFIIGRLKFNDSNSAPFPSCLVHLSITKSYCSVYWYSINDFMKKFSKIYSYKSY